MADFEAAHPGLIDVETRRRSYSQSYLNRASIRACLSNDRLGCVADILRGWRAGANTSAVLRMLVKTAIRHPFR